MEVLLEELKIVGERKQELHRVCESCLFELWEKKEEEELLTSSSQRLFDTCDASYSGTHDKNVFLIWCRAKHWVIRS